MNPFYGETQENLEKWLSICREELAAGKVMSSWAAGDASSNSAVIAGLSVERRIELIYAELSRLDPVRFPMEQMRRVRRTTPRFTW